MDLVRQINYQETGTILQNPNIQKRVNKSHTNSHNSMARPEDGRDDLQVWTVTMNIFKKQYQAADKGKPPVS